jgi:sigma-B regulation protein RsbU (phosphoserine phosphatase)
MYQRQAAAGTATQTWLGPPAAPDEMRIAERVQAHLLPRGSPPPTSLVVAGLCLPGRAVGGDFYDYRPTAEGRLAFLVGDVAGHGVPAALLMATLLATFRAHFALARMDLRERLDSVNRMFNEHVAAEHYATVFVGEYDDRNGTLVYANCGHVPPLLMRAGSTIERLDPTGTVLGLFESWRGRVVELRLRPGDTLVAVTDGIVEAPDPAAGEFGECRLRSSMIRHRRLEPRVLVRAIARDLRLACGRRPGDDSTVVVARARDRSGRSED